MKKEVFMLKNRTLTWHRLTLGAAGMLLWGNLAGCGPSSFFPDPNTKPAPTDPAPEPEVPEIPITPATNAPPAISGGTMLILHDDVTAVAADPDRDAVWLADLSTLGVRKRVVLPAGSEPGRVIEDQDGNVHVATRRGGQLVKIDPHDGKIVSSRAVCAAPRGVAYDAPTDNLYVACAGGELVTLKARGGDILRTAYLDRDLRDVVVKGDHLLVSRFRSAELLDVNASGAVVARVKPRTAVVVGSKDSQGNLVSSSPTTAWRTMALADGSVMMLHQRGLDSVISTQPGGYGGGPCKSGISSSSVTQFTGGGSSGALSAGGGAITASSQLAVDVAVAPDGQLALISAGSGVLNGVAIMPRGALGPTDDCQFPTNGQPADPNNQLIAGAYDSKGTLWVQARNPARIYSLSRSATIEFSGAEDRSSAGHKFFYTFTKGGIACASCHAEAGDDGHVWNFDKIGPRRTQSLRGGILATAPFHWDGDMNNLTTLMTQVFSGRMSGGQLTANDVADVGAWLDAQPSLPKSAPRNPEAVLRGKTLFEDATVGCASCHSGAHFTNNQSLLVGTGKVFQVPSLTDVAARAPYLHTGCAATLRDRFDPACGGGDSHGKTSQLAATQIDDLVAYLETL